MSRALRFAVSCACLLFLAEVPASGDTQFAPVGIKVRQSWVVHKTDLALTEAPATSFLDNQEAFAKLWKAWRTDAVPRVDFGKEIVLVLTAPENAAVMLTAELDNKGVLRISNRSTLRRSLGMTYVLAIVDRAAIKAIGKTAVPAPK